MRDESDEILSVDYCYNVGEIQGKGDANGTY